MTEIERKLQVLANKLHQESQRKYDSRFIRIVNVLQNAMQVSEIKRGGSRAKLTYNAGKGDLDIIFTYVRTDKSRKEVFDETCRILLANFGTIAKVEQLNVSVKLQFSREDFNIDVVYLPYSEYLENVSELKNVREANPIHRDAICLIKLWNEEHNNRGIKPFQIESFVLSHGGRTLYDNIVQFGAFLDEDNDMTILFWLENYTFEEEN